MKSLAAYLRIVFFLLLAFLIIELVVPHESGLAINEHPLIWLVLAVVLLLAVGIEIFLVAVKNIIKRGLSQEGKEKFEQLEAEDYEKNFGWVRATYLKLLNQKPLEEEDEIILDHNYDGIQELDNDLPSWWLYGFYITVIFAGVYMTRYHIFDGPDQEEEFITEVAQAEEEIEAYKRENPDLINADNVELLTEASDLEAGEGIFLNSCAACHRADGGGSIGPNLTDEHWILGGGISNVYNTISEGGRDGKGMVAWKSDLNPQEIAQVASYVLSLQGTEPEEPKAPEGDVWEEE